ETCFSIASRRRHTRCYRDWSSDVCSSDLAGGTDGFFNPGEEERIVRFLSRTQTPDAMQKRFSPALDLTRDERRSANRGESPKNRSEERRVGKERSAGWVTAR